MHGSLILCLVLAAPFCGAMLSDASAPFNYTVKGNTNITCLRMTASIAINATINGTSHQFLVPENTTVSGSCNPDRNTLNISWISANISVDLVLEMVNANNKTFDLDTINITYSLANSSSKFSNSSLNLFATNFGQYYHCENSISVWIGENVSLQLWQVTLQAFRNKSDDSYYGEVHDCNPLLNTTTGQPTTTVAMNTTSAVPTTTATPTPSAHNYSVQDNNNITCLLMTAAMEINVTINGTSKWLLVPEHVNMSGSCNSSRNTLSISWISANISVDLVLEIVNVNNQTFDLDTINITYSLANSSSQLSNSSLNLFATNIGQYYHCTNIAKVQLSENASLQLSQVTLQAFRNKPDANYYGDVNDCNPVPSTTSAPKTNAIVPIAVGAALAGLVVIVLIGYCIGRRRNRPGYQQMA